MGGARASGGRAPARQRAERVRACGDNRKSSCRRDVASGRPTVRCRRGPRHGPAQVHSVQARAPWSEPPSRLGPRRPPRCQLKRTRERRTTWSCLCRWVTIPPVAPTGVGEIRNDRPGRRNPWIALAPHHLPESPPRTRHGARCGTRRNVRVPRHGLHRPCAHCVAARVTRSEPRPRARFCGRVVPCYLLSRAARRPALERAKAMRRAGAAASSHTRVHSSPVSADRG